MTSLVDRAVVPLAGWAMLALTLGCAPEPMATETMTSEPTTIEPGATERSPAVELLDPPTGAGAMAPNFWPGDEGVFLTWLEPDVDTGHGLFLSQLTGGQWTSPRRVAEGETFFANWADLPGVVETEPGVLSAHWLDKLGDGTYAYGARLAYSLDGGRSWHDKGLLHDDDQPTEHGFVSYAPLADGATRAFWLDGRAMPGGGGMQLRTTRLDDGEPGASELLDERVCECCATDAALAADGPVVAYRDRSSSEIRDIAVVRVTDEGWSLPTVIHDDGWQIYGCPVNGPAVAANGQLVAVAWFTAPSNEARVMLAFSDDGGATFGTPIVIDDDMPLGHVDLVLDDEDRAWVAWVSSAVDTKIHWQWVTANGEHGPVRTVTSTTPRRSAGVPRMIRSGDRLVFTWVEDTEPSRVRVGVVPLSEG